MTEPLETPVIRTERLTLRPFSMDDAPALRLLLSTPEVSRTTLRIPYPYPEGAAESWIASHAERAAQRKGWSWAIVVTTTDQVAGAVGLALDESNARGAFGYWLGVDYWNNGYMSEAVRAVADWALDVFGLHRIEAECFTWNPASARVMEKAGMRYEGTLRGYVQKAGTFHDLLMYARLADDPDSGPPVLR